MSRKGRRHRFRDTLAADDRDTRIADYVANLPTIIPEYFDKYPDGYAKLPFVQRDMSFLADVAISEDEVQFSTQLPLQQHLGVTFQEGVLLRSIRLNPALWRRADLLRACRREEPSDSSTEVATDRSGDNLEQISAP